MVIKLSKEMFSFANPMRWYSASFLTFWTIIQIVTALFFGKDGGLNNTESLVINDT